MKHGLYEIKLIFLLSVIQLMSFDSKKIKIDNNCKSMDPKELFLQEICKYNNNKIIY